MGNYSNEYTKILNNREYQITIQRAELVGRIAGGMSMNLWETDQYVQDTEKQWGPEDEMPQKLQKKLEKLKENMELQKQFLPALDQLVGHMVIEAVFCFKMCTTLYP